MKSPQRRRLIRSAAALAALGAAAAAGLPGARMVFAQRADTPRVVEMLARRFRYEPAELTLKAGERVVLAIRSLDFMHGFSIPDLGIRANLIPGQVTRIELQPKAPGVIDFLCDNFCGDGHEEMHGRLVVT